MYLINTNTQLIVKSTGLILKKHYLLLQAYPGLDCIYVEIVITSEPSFGVELKIVVGIHKTHHLSK